jgi:hypothetical protein
MQERHQVAEFGENGGDSNWWKYHPEIGCLALLWQACLSEARDEMTKGFFRLPAFILQYL